MFLLLTFVAFGASLIWSGFEVATGATLVFALLALVVRTVVLMPVLRLANLEPGSCRIIAWLGPRGLSSLLLVLLPVFAGIEGSLLLFQITCLVVLLSVVLHGGGITLFLRRAAKPGGKPAGVVTAPAAGAVAAPIPARGEQPEELSFGEAVPEKITIPELRRLLAEGEPVTVLDVRTERSYRDDPQMAEGAIRMPPDDAVRLARERGLDHHGTLVLYCT
jgi:cell volume regulation protein A